MNYQQTIEYLYAQLPMFSRIGAAAYKKDLHNTIELCQALGNPQNKFKSVHVAGTNGKGSTSHMLAAIFQQAGYKTGLYTSPHLKDFGERIRINGEMIAPEFVISFVERTKDLAKKVEPSFFELTVAMAFEYFAEQQVDIAIIETGLGGRLDSTNIITPLLSIITNIGWDHMNILGNSLESIAAEKAGIIKKGVPVVVGAELTETKQIFLDKAAAEGSALKFAEHSYKAREISATARALSCTMENLELGTMVEYTLDLNGLYQAHNLATVLTATDILNQAGFKLGLATQVKALSRVKMLTGLHGRWEVVREEPLVVMDVAHNEDGIRQIMLQLERFYKDRQYHFVIGVVKDKDADAVLRQLPPSAKFYFTNAHIPRAKPAKELQADASNYNLSGEVFNDVNTATEAAIASATHNDVIIICGSVFLIGEVDFEKLKINY